MFLCLEINAYEKALAINLDENFNIQLYGTVTFFAILFHFREDKNETGLGGI